MCNYLFNLLWQNCNRQFVTLGKLNHGYTGWVKAMAYCQIENESFIYEIV